MSPEPPNPSLLDRPRRTLRSMVPVVRWLPSYSTRTNLTADLIAGIALAALLIPESMGYAGVAGVPAEVGLYAALGAVVAYALTGGTSILVVGPASAVAALSASIVGDFHGVVDPVQLTAALAITSGVLLVAAGALRLGWIVNFISRPVLDAFVAGLSISIIIGQLDGLFGVEVHGHSAVAKLVDTVRSIGEWHTLTTVIGLGGLVLLLLLERVVPRVPAALVVVAAGIMLVSVFNLASHGVAVVGEIPQGLPHAGIPDLSATRWLELLGAGFTLLLVGFSETYASASAVAATTKETIDADQELIGSGAANIAAGLVGGLAVSGSLSKSAASQSAGARTQVANLVGGVAVLATLLFLAPVFKDLPEPVLAAVVIVAVLGSASPRKLLDLWSVNRTDFAAALATFVLVLFWEALPAMIVGVALSLAFLVRRASFPDVVELRRTDNKVFRRVEETGSDDLAAIPGVAIIRFEAPLLYANAERLHHASLALLDRPREVHRLVLDAEMITDIDTSGADMLAELDTHLAEQGVELHLASVRRRARVQLRRSLLAERFEGRVHRTVAEAAGFDDGNREGPGT